MSPEKPTEFRYPGEGDGSEPPRADDQTLFDTVVGPNMRLRDNLIQLAAIIAGSALGAWAGGIYARSVASDASVGMLLGGFAGLVLSLLLSGMIIGLVRAILAARR